MTMKLTIKNEDSTRSARVRTRMLHVNADGSHSGATSDQGPPVELAPGASGEFWVHRNQDILVEEV